MVNQKENAAGLSKKNGGMFQRIYDFCIKLSKHRLAPVFLCANSFIESIFWPLPPDALLIPMCLARPNRALVLAFWTTIFSVLGAMIGYGLGYWFFDGFLGEIIAKLGYGKHVETIKAWFVDMGILFVAIGAFTPIPYKVIAWTVGMMAAAGHADVLSLSEQLSLVMFALVSFLGRGARFGIEAVFIRAGGEAMADKVRKYIDAIGWVCVVLVVVGIIVYKIWA